MAGFLPSTTVGNISVPALPLFTSLLLTTDRGNLRITRKQENKKTKILAVLSIITK
jgi:hypothetical protein